MKSRLTIWTRQGYGIGALSIALLNTSMLFFLAKFLVDEAGLDPAVAGNVVFLEKMWDAITDPLVGRLSDHTKTRWGTRRPWLVGGIVPLAFLFILVWTDLPVDGWWRPFSYAFVLMAYSTAYTMVVVPYGAITPSLTEDYDERTRLNSARMGWSMVGGIIAAIVMPVWRERTGGYGSGSVLIGVMAVIPVLITFFSTAGLDLKPVNPRKISIWSVWKNLAFLKVAALFIAAWSTIAVLGALLPFYVQHFLGRPDLEDAIFASVQLSALVSIPVVGWAATKWEKHTAYAIFSVGWAVVLMMMTLVPPGNATLALGVAVLAGPGLAAAHVLPWSMLPDIVELDEQQTGVSRAGAFYGVLTFLEKVSTAVALKYVLTGLADGGYSSGAAVQPEEVIRRISWLIGPTPALVLLAASALAWFSPPITREQHRALLRSKPHHRS